MSIQQAPTLQDIDRLGHKKNPTQTMIASVAKTDLLDSYFARLADNLMLNELLCGECDPVEFLKNEIIRTHEIICAEKAEQRGKYLRTQAAKRQGGE